MELFEWLVELFEWLMELVELLKLFGSIEKSLRRTMGVAVSLMLASDVGEMRKVDQAKSCIGVICWAKDSDKYACAFAAPTCARPTPKTLCNLISVPSYHNACHLLFIDSLHTCSLFIYSLGIYLISISYFKQCIKKSRLGII